MKSSSRRKLFYCIGALLCFSISQCSGSKVIRTSARSIAVRAGASQFKESIEEFDHATRRDRRLADTHDQDDNLDDDYEVYQGVVGRPGIDFPVLVGIPITGFNCRRMGNGYFADLETDCQVFHICDSGRKISFLCPNGTIFKQNELICDWWFKVDCLQSPRQYAESSELLQRHRTRDRPVKFSTTALYDRDSTTKSSPRPQKEQSVQQQVQYQGRSRVRPTQVTPSPTPKQNVEFLVDEDYDFEDVNTVASRSTTRKPSTTFTRSTARSRQIEDESPVTLDDQIDYSTETQEVAESGSFVQPNGGYALNRPNDEEDNRKIANKSTKKPEKVLIVVEDDSIEVPVPTSNVRSRSSTTITPTTSTTTTTTAPSTTSTTSTTTTTTTTTTTPPAPTTASTRRPMKTTTVGATTFSRRGSAKYRGNSGQSELTLTTSTPSFDNENSYTTAKRLGTTKSNISPFYTPTVPTIINRNNNDNEASSTIPTPIQFSTTESTPAEHAIEMIKTLKTLESIDDDILPPFEIVKSFDIQPRAGLNIPPSSGPDTLNSLANYFATAVDSLVKTNATEATPSQGNSTEEAIVDAGLLSSKTIAKYGQLFGKETNATDELPQLPEIVKVNTEKNIDSRIGSIEDHTEDLIDLKTEFSTNSLFSSSTPQVRELAQVFTHALSAYLHDPEEFRQILTGIRPTEPPALLSNDQLDEILSNRIGRTDVYGNPTVSTNGASYLPTSTASSFTTEIPASTSDDLEVLDFSDVTVSNILKKDTTESGINLTTEKLDDVTTTSSLDEITTLAGLTSTAYPIKEKKAFNINADKTPGSDIIARGLLNDITTTTDTITTETGNPLAMEVNKILLNPTAFPYLDGEDEKTDSSDIGNYFPENLGDNNKTAYKPYGNELNVNSTPIADEKLFTNTQSIPLRWNDEESSTVSINSENQSTTVSALVSDLVPPKPSLSSIAKILLIDADVEDSTSADEEQLQRAHSQSIVAGVNQLKESGSHKVSIGKSENLVEKVVVSSTGNPIASRLYPIRGHYITQKYPATTEESITELAKLSTITTEIPTSTDVSSSETTTSYPGAGKYSPNPWQSLAYTVYLNPLTINDELMDDFKGTTTETSIITSTGVKAYSAEVTTTETAVNKNKADKIISESITPTAGTVGTTESTTKITANDVAQPSERRGKTFPTTSFPTSRLNVDDTNNNEEILQSIEEPMEIMRERANEIFGNLNETQANSLMNVMKTADENKTVRRLILLLIQTCDDDYNKTLEESRNALLNALIGMDHTFDGEPEIQIINTRRASKRSGSVVIPLAVVRSATTTAPITQTTANSISIEEASTVNTEFRIDLSDENDFYSTSTQNSQEITTTNEPTTTTIPAIETTTATSSTTVLDSKEETTTTFISTTLTPTTTTPQSTTTVTEEITTIRSRKRTGKSLDSSLGIADLQTSDNNSKHSDERALELLKSLYSLASKWGKR